MVFPNQPIQHSKEIFYKYLTHLMVGCILMGTTSCLLTPEIPEFSKSKWLVPMTDCTISKVDQAEIIIKNKDVVLGLGQATIKKLFGKPDEHELYLRTQKFFYYDLTSEADSCQRPFQRLSIRFDALDRVKELLIIEGVSQKETKE